MEIEEKRTTAEPPAPRRPPAAEMAGAKAGARTPMVFASQDARYLDRPSQGYIVMCSSSGDSVTQLNPNQGRPVLGGAGRSAVPGIIQLPQAPPPAPRSAGGGGILILPPATAVAPAPPATYHDPSKANFRRPVSQRTLYDPSQGSAVHHGPPPFYQAPPPTHAPPPRMMDGYAASVPPAPADTSCAAGPGSKPAWYDPNSER